MKRISILIAHAFALAAIAACGGHSVAIVAPAKTAPAPASAPPAAGSSAANREQPPPPSATKESPFPAVHRSKLANGLELDIVSAPALPIVQIRVLVHAGMNYGMPAAAEITAHILKDGGTRTVPSAELLRRIETLGATLGIDVDLDATVLSMGVVKTHLDEALAILGDVVQHPRFDETELAKLKSRETDEAASHMRSSGTWGARFIVQRELSAATSPYAEADVLPSTIAKVTAPVVRDFHKRYYVPKNVTLVIAGDVAPEATSAIAERVFGGWKGGDAPKVDFPAAIAPSGRRVILVHRPKSTQSDVFVASLMPPRKSSDWPSLRVAMQVYGGGATGRLFLDVREQRSLAYSAQAQIAELGHGDQPLLSYAGTQTPKTGLAVQGLLDNIARMGSAPPTPQETATARRFLSDVFAVRMETIGSIADMIVSQSKLDLPDTQGGSYWDAYRAALKQVTETDAAAAASKLFHADKALVVVAGDADVIATSLSHFGDVTVVDPTHEFTTIKTLPKNENAPLEIEQPK
jgi:zinc protease